jgi:hypothetical protein
MSRTIDQWVNLLAERFGGTEYEALHANYRAWAVSVVAANDDPEDVFAAWITHRSK